MKSCRRALSGLIAAAALTLGGVDSAVAESTASAGRTEGARAEASLPAKLPGTYHCNVLPGGRNWGLLPSYNVPNLTLRSDGSYRYAIPHGATYPGGTYKYRDGELKLSGGFLDGTTAKWWRNSKSHIGLARPAVTGKWVFSPNATKGKHGCLKV